MTLKPSILALGITLLAFAGAAPLAAQDQPNPQMVEVAYVRARPGELPRLIRFYQVNWARSRRTLLAQGIIAGYQLRVRADTLGDYDVELHTEYPDSAAWERREEIFRPVMAAQGRTLVDGLDRSSLGDIVEVRLFRSFPARP